MVQDVATQCLQSYPCKEKTSQETEQSLGKFSNGQAGQQSFVLTILWYSVKLVKIHLGITCPSTPQLSETNCMAGRAVRRLNEGTSAALLQSSLDESWWLIPWNVAAFCKTFKTSYWTGKDLVNCVLDNHLVGQ